MDDKERTRRRAPRMSHLNAGLERTLDQGGRRLDEIGPEFQVLVVQSGSGRRGTVPDATSGSSRPLSINGVVARYPPVRRGCARIGTSRLPWRFFWKVHRRSHWYLMPWTCTARDPGTPCRGCRGSGGCPCSETCTRRRKLERGKSASTRRTARSRRSRRSSCSPRSTGLLTWSGTRVGSTNGRMPVRPTAGSISYRTQPRRPTASASGATRCPLSYATTSSDLKFRSPCTVTTTGSPPEAGDGGNQGRLEPHVLLGSRGRWYGARNRAPDRLLTGDSSTGTVRWAPPRTP